MLQILLEHDKDAVNIPLQNIGNHVYVLPKISSYELLFETLKSFFSANSDLTEKNYSHFMELTTKMFTNMENLKDSLKEIKNSETNSSILNQLFEYSEKETWKQKLDSIPKTLLFTGGEKGYLRCFDGCEMVIHKDFGRFHDWDVQSVA